MAIRFGTSSQHAAIAGDSAFPSTRTVRRAIREQLRVGEINEDKIILGGEESARLSIKGYYPAKNGLLACLFTAEGVATHDANVREQGAARKKHVGHIASGRIGGRLTPEIAASLPVKDKTQQKLMRAGSSV